MPELIDIQHDDIARENRHRRVDAGRLYKDDTAMGRGGEDHVHQDAGRTPADIVDRREDTGGYR